jgi:hypothetical protein
MQSKHFEDLVSTDTIVGVISEACRAEVLFRWEIGAIFETKDSRNNLKTEVIQVLLQFDGAMSCSWAH